MQPPRMTVRDPMNGFTSRADSQDVVVGAGNEEGAGTEVTANATSSPPRSPLRRSMSGCPIAGGGSKSLFSFGLALGVASWVALALSLSSCGGGGGCQGDFTSQVQIQSSRLVDDGGGGCDVRGTVFNGSDQDLFIFLEFRAFDSRGALIARSHSGGNVRGASSAGSTGTFTAPLEGRGDVPKTLRPSA